MSAVSTAQATVAAGPGSLLGGTSDGSGSGSTAGKAPSSFGTALALAEQVLAVDAARIAPADGSERAPRELAVPEEGIAPALPIATGADAAADAGADGRTIPDATDLHDAAPDAEQTALMVAIPVPTSVAPAITPAPTAPERLIREGAGPGGAVDAGARPGPAPDAIHAPLAAGIAVAPPAQASEGARATLAAPSAAPPVAAAAAAAAGEAGHPTGPSADVSAARPDVARPDAARPDVAVPSSSIPASAVAVSPPSSPVVSAPDSASAAAPRTVATQVVPAVLSIVQRPVGSHQLTMTVTPDTLGPVTVRAHISAGGEVRVELVGASDAGREALRALVTDLRRDLASVMPHASLSLATGSTAGTTPGATGGPADAAGLDRGSHPGGGGATNGQTSGERAPGHGSGIARVRGDDGTGRAIPPFLPTTTPAASGEGLDIFA